MKFTEADLDRLIASIIEMSKYRSLSVDLIRRIGTRELTNQPNFKLAESETRNRLHLAAGAYMDKRPNYTKWLAELQEISSIDELRMFSLEKMQAHASTRERLPIVQLFYSDLIQKCGPIHSILDIACGLNPLAVLEMNLASGSSYFAFDLYADMMELLNAFFSKAASMSDFKGSAIMLDCAASPPSQSADLAVILKFLPVLEQLNKGATLEWLKKINAVKLLLSFPTRTLAGRSKGMSQNYEDRFLATIQGENWNVERFEFNNELCFVVKR